MMEKTVRRLRKIRVNPAWVAHAKDTIKEGREKNAPKNLDQRGFDIDEMSALGESSVADALGVSVERGDGYSMTYAGKKIAVVTQSLITRTPNVFTTWAGLTPEEYEATKNCDAYVFVRANPGEKHLWIGGWLTRAEFVEKSKFVERGERLGCRQATRSAHRVLYIKLKPIDELKEMKE